MLSTRYDFLTSVRNRRFGLKEKQSDLVNRPISTRYRVISSKFFTSLAITLVIIVTQIFLFYYYFDVKLTDTYFGGGRGAIIGGGEWKCILSKLDPVQELANRFGVDLVVVDPVLLKILDPSDNDPINSISFTKSTKVNQESTHKSVVHLAAINETSGGQPNLKLFYNGLKSNDYTLLKYVENNPKHMPPEVYQRAPHLLDDMHQDGDGIVGHRYSHDSNDLHNLEIDNPFGDSGVEEVSKIYTEFLTHIFILNQTSTPSGFNGKACESSGGGGHFIAIHIFVLYNFRHDPENFWYQPGLSMDEMDKHKLLNYNIHSFDFEIPIEQPYLHRKRPISEISNLRVQEKKTMRARVFEPRGDRLLRYANNTYVQCEESQFSISGLRDAQKPLNKYLEVLDSSKPIKTSGARNLVQEQLVFAFRFMKTFSVAYGNFSFWLTGSSLMSYYRDCDLMLSLNPSDDDDDITVNLELGLFSSEVNASVLADLASANDIVTMLSDWKKPYALTAFQLKDCPNLIIYLYFYELKRDFYEYYFITRRTMTSAPKFHRRARSTVNNSNRNFDGHHVFNTNNLNLCCTQIDNLPSFRVPCNVHDHLRRIYVL